MPQEASQVQQEISRIKRHRRRQICRIIPVSYTHLKLIGISGGVSYGALGMTHHSATDIADMASIPGMRVYLPSDRFQTRKLMEALYQDDQTAYIRVGRYAVPDVYSEDRCV